MTAEMFDFKRMVDLCDTYPQINTFFRIFLGHLYNFSHQRELSFLYESAEERYLNLFKERPKVVRLIPQKYIASYLGVRPESLSRIRREIGKEPM
jgi:CRP/FNR family transcriptional regulator, anaerobic regulatory protein